MYSTAWQRRELGEPIAVAAMRGMRDKLITAERALTTYKEALHDAREIIAAIVGASVLSSVQPWKDAMENAQEPVKPSK